MAAFAPAIISTSHPPSSLKPEFAWWAGGGGGGSGHHAARNDVCPQLGAGLGACAHWHRQLGSWDDLEDTFSSE